MRDNKFYQRRTMQRIPETPAQAEGFLWHAINHLLDNFTTEDYPANRPRMTGPEIDNELDAMVILRVRADLLK